MCIRDRGNTSGWGFGAMYELTYDVYLNEDKSSILQPPVSYTHLVTGDMAMAAGSSFTFDMTGLTAGGNALVTLTGGLTLMDVAQDVRM